MKWLKEVYGLFVDDPRLAIMALVGLLIALLVARIGWAVEAGPVLFIVVAGALVVSAGRR